MIRVLRGDDVRARAGLMDAVSRLGGERLAIRHRRALPYGTGGVDPYDGEDAGYIAVLDEDGDRLLGCARMNHTLRASLLADMFPHLNETGEPHRATTLYEGTRFALSPDLLPDRDAVRKVRTQIYRAAAGWAEGQGGTQLQAVVDYDAFPHVVEMTARTRPLGLPGEYGGGPRVPGGGRCIAFRWDLDPDLLAELEIYDACGDTTGRCIRDTLH